MPTTNYKPAPIVNRTNEILVYGEIGGADGVSAEYIRRRVNEIDDSGTADQIDVRVNSYGGDVFEGMAAAYALQQSPVPVVVHIDGIAASIASVIAMGGGAVRETRMSASAQLMIHNSWTVVSFAGDQRALADGAAELEKMTGVLQSIDRQIVEAYSRKTNIAEATLRTWMDEETWFDSTSALEFGFVDSVVDVPAVAACAIPDGLFRDSRTMFCKPPLISAERRVRRASVDYAQERIRAGRFNASADWSFSAADGNRLLGPDADQWERYAKAHLAENEEAEPRTKARFSYPFAKLDSGGELTVYRSALAAIRQRSAAEDDGNIYDAAGRLMEAMDREEDASNATRASVGIMAARQQLWQRR